MSLPSPARLHSGRGLDVLPASNSGCIVRQVFIWQSINVLRNHATLFRCGNVSGSGTLWFHLVDSSIPSTLSESQLPGIQDGTRASITYLIHDA